ncbi:MAG TPA: MYXO-CTERM sorting domain-containing protein, partial [Polyangiaceae bacterium]|nr:MYXO-CTERM sorting domain-containing protein [Polyangiaceae bacterium]
EEKPDDGAEGSESSDSGEGEGETADDGAEDTEQMDLQGADDEELENDGEVKEKPGGCGCRLAGTPAPPQSLLGVLLFGAAFWLRRRQ